VKRVKATRATPLQREISKIQQGSPVAPVLRLVVGDALAERTITAAVRVRHLEGTGEGLRPSPKIRHRGTAKVEFAPEQVRPTTELCVRRMVLLVLMILEKLPPKGDRIISRQLWLGPHTGPGVGESLAARLGCSVREIERYLVVLRQAGVLTAYQPPDGVMPDEYVGRSGKPFNIYRLCGEMPRELLLLLRPAYAAEARAIERAKEATEAASFLERPESTASPPEPRERKASAAALAAFMKMVPP